MNPLTADSTNNSFSPGEILQEKKDNIHVWIKNTSVEGFADMMQGIIVAAPEVGKVCAVSICVLLADQMRDCTVLNERLVSAAVHIGGGSLLIFTVAVTVLLTFYIKRQQ